MAMIPVEKYIFLRLFKGLQMIKTGFSTHLKDIESSNKLINQNEEKVEHKSNKHPISLDSQQFSSLKIYVQYY